MPNRNIEGDYRYGYQGEFAEKEPELGNGQNSFELRLWDSRIGRWLTTDPYGQYASPYLGMGNNPINGVDPDGGLFGRIRAWAHKLFNGGEIFKNDYDKWVWSSGPGEMTGYMTDGFNMNIGEFRNFGYGGLGKLTTNSSSWHISGKADVGLLNHGLDIGLGALEFEHSTTLASFNFGQTTNGDGSWNWNNEFYRYRKNEQGTRYDKFSGVKEKRVTIAYGLETRVFDLGYVNDVVYPAGTNHKNMNVPVAQSSQSVEIGAAIVTASIHNISKDGIDFDFNIGEDWGVRFFGGLSVSAGVSSSYSWKF